MGKKIGVPQPLYQNLKSNASKEGKTVEELISEIILKRISEGSIMPNKAKL